jgi:hypothetical protein
VNAQELFDRVSLHLLAQNRTSVNAHGRCAYRGEGDLKCAIGVLIPDELYSPDMDTKCSLTRVTEITGIEEHYELCVRLQEIHDCYEVSMWSTKLANLAKEFNL